MVRKEALDSSTAGRLLPGVIITMWDFMEIFHAALFIRLISNIDKHYTLLSNTLPGLLKFRFKKSQGSSIENLDSIYAAVEKSCASLELVASRATARKMREAVQHGRYGEFFKLGKEFSGRFKDELDGRCVLVLSGTECSLLEKPQEGWEEVINRFPKCVMDVEEASKCYAFGRYAGSVFHSLQVVEVGLIELCHIFCDKDPLPGWTSATKHIDEILKKKYTDRTAFQRKHTRFLEQTGALISSIKNAWRNKVSHAHGKLTLLTADFTESVSYEILVASRSFMRRLATELPTTPDPDA